MPKLPNSIEHHHHDQHDSHEHGHHDHNPHNWDSPEYVSHWAEGQDQKELDRQEAFRLLAETIPYDKSLPIRILDVGAGYGALTQFLLGYFPNATAVCQDGSEEMIKLGRYRLASYRGRFTSVPCNFSKSGWSRELTGPFEAVVSSIAIHNVNSPSIIRGIYDEIFPLVKPGGCFLNFDLIQPPWEDQLRWVKQAGFADVKFFWKEARRALFGGFKR